MTKEIKTGYGKQGVQGAVGVARCLGALSRKICVRVACARAELKQGAYARMQWDCQKLTVRTLFSVLPRSTYQIKYTRTCLSMPALFSSVGVLSVGPHPTTISNIAFLLPYCDGITTAVHVTTPYEHYPYTLSLYHRHSLIAPHCTCPSRPGRAHNIRPTDRKYI